ncbi:MAG: uracil-DNA glycosylase [Desulforhopalus sp.]|nr:uracil-DNA glycosylase [Desulforhopalus sp.]
MSIDKRNLLSAVHALLRYHQVTGITRYPRNLDCEGFLRFQPVSLVHPQPYNKTEKSTGGSPAGERSLLPPEKTPLTLADIAEEVAACHSCDLHTKRLYPVAGRGPEKVRLLIVGDWLASDNNGQLPPNQLFGVEQDLMLARMLAAIQLPLNSVFVTNVIKCAVPATCQPQAIHVQSCVSFLRRQIAVLRPEAICAMGMVAARAVLEKSLPLSRLRGRLHEYEGVKELKIPVIATYHPTYLLQNAEMKVATWADLQLLAKELSVK